MKDFIYLAAPAAAEAEKQFNAALVELLEEYAFPLFYSWQDGLDPDSDPEGFHKVCTKALYEARLMLLVHHGRPVSSETAFEVGYATLKGIPIISVRSYLNPGETSVLHPLLEKSCVRAVAAPDDQMVNLTHPLLSAINLYF